MNLYTISKVFFLGLALLCVMSVGEARALTISSESTPSASDIGYCVEYGVGIAACSALLADCLRFNPFNYRSCLTLFDACRFMIVTCISRQILEGADLLDGDLTQYRQEP
jgi:hypothetical protein